LTIIRATPGEYNFASQYQQTPAPLEGGLVKRSWFKTYAEADLPDHFDQILLSWDTANKPTQLADYSVSTAGGPGKSGFIRCMSSASGSDTRISNARFWEQAEIHRATIVLIEDKASGTQLIQELVKGGLRIVKAVKPEVDKIMRFNAQTATIENGFVYVPQQTPWLAEYIHEIITFPSAKYDDQADSTSQALAWINQSPLEPGILLTIASTRLVGEKSFTGEIFAPLVGILSILTFGGRLWRSERKSGSNSQRRDDALLALPDIAEDRQGTSGCLSRLTPQE
jgi:predicted phage terminase large subunit-like protein